MYLKASKINSYKELLMSSSLITRLASQVLMIAAVLIIVIQLEYGFTQKKNAKDIEVLAKLGMNKKQISLTLTTHVCIVCFICLILASLICRFIYFDILIDMYCETLVFLITYLLLAVICILILVIRYIFAKKYYSSF
jgi:predicted lysophospholipase L1 biosynthesis ABC-type transport system permease subunit